MCVCVCVCVWCPRLGSFGVVVLEIVSGLKAVDFRQPEVLLVNKVHQFEVRKRPLEALADTGLNGEYNLKELMRLVSLGAACTHSDPKLRPSTTQIVSIIDGNDKTFKDVVKECWTSGHQSGWGGFVLKEKIKEKNCLGILTNTSCNCWG